MIELNKLNNGVKRLFYNFFSLFTLQLITYAVPLISLPYLVNVLGVERFGLVMFAQSVMVFLNVFVDYGFNLSATREISLHRDNKKKITEIYSSVLTLKIYLLLISLVFISIAIFHIDRFKNDMDVYYLSFFLVLGEAISPIWYFQGIERMKYITVANILSKLIFIFTIFFLVKNRDDYILVPILNGLGVLVGSLYSLLLLRIKFQQKFKFQRFSVLKKYFKDSTQYFLSRVSVSIYTSANSVILGLFTNNIIVGYYSVADKLYQAIQSLYNPIVQVLYPYITKEKNITLFKKIFFSAVILNIVGIIFVYLFGESVLNLVFVNGISNVSLNIFYILLVANVFVVPSILLGYPFLGALGFVKAANESVIYGSFIHFMILLIFILTNNVSLYFIALSVIITEFSIFIFRWHKVLHYKLWSLK